MTAPILLSYGTSTAPGLAFSGDTDAGIWGASNSVYIQNQSTASELGRSVLTLSTEAFSIQATEGADTNKKVFLQASDAGGGVMRYLQYVYSAGSTYAGWQLGPQSASWRFNTAGAGEIKVVSFGTTGFKLHDEADDTKTVLFDLSNITTSTNHNIALPDQAGTIAIAGANGLVTRTAADAFSGRTISSGTGISVANGDGVAGNPTVSIDSATTPQFSSGVGDVPATGSVGTFYAETDANSFYTYPSTDTEHWLLSTAAGTTIGDFFYVSAVDVLTALNGTDGNLITWDASDVPALVATGSAGQVLTSNGAGAAPTFQAAGAGDMILANVQTVTGAKTFGTIGGAVGKFILAGSTSGSTILNAAAVAGTTTVTLPAATDTLMGKATTDTMTNKTFDANGTGNSLSNVDVADLANGTDGQLITWDAAAAPATVATGTSGQVLTSNGAGAAPTFQAAAGGSYDYTTISITEEFQAGDSNTDGEIGTHGWFSHEISGGGTVDPGANHTLPHWGFRRQYSHATNDNSGGKLSLLATNGLSGATGWHSGTEWSFEAIYQVGADSTAITNIGFYIGLENGYNALPEAASAAIRIRYDTDHSDSTFIFQVCDSATNGCEQAADNTNNDVVASTVSPLQGNWYYFTIRHVTSGVGGNPTTYFSVNEETEKTFCSAGCDDDLGNAPTGAMFPSVSYLTRTTTGILKGHIDMVHVEITGLTRYD
jgi:hypothetical protein